MTPLFSSAKVSTSVFGIAHRHENSTWKALFKEAHTKFEPVALTASSEREATDAAIVTRIEDLVADAEPKCIALLTEDFDFAPVLEEVRQADQKAMIFTTAKNKAVIERYQKMGVEVVELKPKKRNLGRLRALIHPDGHGSVALEDPFQPEDDMAEEKLLLSCLL